MIHVNFSTGQRDPDLLSFGGMLNWIRVESTPLQPTNEPVREVGEAASVVTISEEARQLSRLNSPDLQLPILDNDAPKVTRFLPADGSTGARPTDNIVLTFNEAIVRGSGAIVLKDAQGNTVESFDAASSTRISIRDNTLTINPTKDLDYDSQYTVSFAAGTVQDTNGNAYAGTTSYDFTTKADDEAPVVKRFSPASGSSGAKPTVNIALTFNEAIARGSGAIVLKDAQGNTVESFDAASSTRISIRDKILTINPTKDLDYNSQYTVSFAAGTVLDTNANAYSGTISYDFTTKVDDEAPVVKRFSPADGSTGAKPTANIVLTFNEAIARGAGAIVLKDAQGNTVESFNAADSSRISIRDKTLTINPTIDLDYNSQYTVSFAAGTVQDTNGNAYAGATTYDFTTKVDDEGPVVKRFSPGDGSSGAKPTANIVLTFNEAISRGAGAIVLKDAQGNTVESFNAADSGRISIRDKTLTINPTIDLDYNSQYTVSFADGTVQDTNGNAYAGTSSYDFTTKADDEAPVVKRFAPADGSSTAKVSANIVLTFNEAIERGSGTIVLKDGSGNTVESFDAASSSRISINDKTFTLNPTRNLAYDSQYTVTFEAGTVQDTNGNAYAGTSSYDFRTEADSGEPEPPSPPPSGGDTTAPTVTSFSPTDNSTGASVSANVVLSFNENIKRGVGNITLKDAAGNTIETFDAATSDRIGISGKTLTLNPTNDLANGTRYFVTFAQGSVKDLAGNNYAGTSTYDFTTAPLGSDFNIEISYNGNEAYRTYFDQAAAIWEQVVIGDLPPINGVDDLRISAAVNAIDGAGGILGSAGPTNLRGGSLLPYLGQMQFDSADMAGMVSSGTMLDVVLHEMGHVLGLGSLWSMFGLNTTPGQYTGENGLAEYRQLSGNSNAAYVPLENGGGGGTANVHWEEDIFDRELMTGYAEGSGNMPLSRLTIAALADLGYTVNYGAAENYSLPSSVAAPTVDLKA